MNLPHLNLKRTAAQFIVAVIFLLGFVNNAMAAPALSIDNPFALRGGTAIFTIQGEL